jgi:hypothetical protein
LYTQENEAGAAVRLLYKKEWWDVRQVRPVTVTHPVTEIFDVFHGDHTVAILNTENKSILREDVTVSKGKTAHVEIEIPCPA